MVYSKTNWVDNTTPIDKDNLNKIEQGIYDNSLVADAVTNTLNPTDTETYKTAELTEGQITDVIGVNDIVIKGQTSQDRTPTPSAPVDVNVVSGSNVINIKSKNLININKLALGYVLNGSGEFSTNHSCEEMHSEFIKVLPNTEYTFKIFETSWNGKDHINWIGIGEYRNAQTNSFIQRDVMDTGTQKYYTITTTANTNYIVVSARGLESATKIQLEIGSTATDYTPYYQGKELPLDLPVENLINPQNLELYGNYRYVKSADDYYINVNANTAYTFSIKEFTGDGRLYEYDKDNNLLKENQLYSALKNGYITITTTENTKKIRFYASMYSSTPTEIPTVYTPQCMLFKGSLPSPYTPYGTEPIELCKIENYQDYFYKFENDWYLHKEINKITSYNGETISTSYVSTTGELSTGAKVYYVVNSTNTKITNTNLISQLEAIYNAPLYEQTNITQTNNDLPMVLDITACKDNINGIKAFIRK